jgi:hypothetical protein
MEIQNGKTNSRYPQFGVESTRMTNNQQSGTKSGARLSVH